MTLFETHLNFPRQEMHPISERLEKLLLICCYDPSQITVEIDAIAQIQTASRYAVVVLNLFEYQAKASAPSLPSVLNLNAFQGLMIHSSLLNDINRLEALDQFLKVKIKAFSGAKLLLVNQKIAASPPILDYFKTVAGDEQLLLNERASHSETLKFVMVLDERITQILRQKACVIPSVFSSKKAAKNILLLAPHEPFKDPRLSWVSDSAPQNLNVIQLGLKLQTSESMIVYHDELGDKFDQQHVPDTFNEALLIRASKTAAGAVGVEVLLLLRRMLTLSEVELSEQYALPYASCRNANFMWYIRYFCRVTQILLAEAVMMRGLHAIIASDLPTLLPALILKGLFDIPVFYDAHEYWPEQDAASFEFEKQFWQDLEKKLLVQTDYCQTVSSTLAALMTEQYQKHFESVPNCIPLTDIPATDISPQANHDQLQKTTVRRFIFQGGFAKGRGIELLIQVWPKVCDKALLMLRGPDGLFKQQMIVLARQTGLLDKRIFFLPAVSEAELIGALQDHDVGVIPYEPVLANNTNCCPNKLSQYFSVKLPVLSNKTIFIEKIMQQSQAGQVVDFSDEQALIQAINFFVEHEKIASEMGERGYQFLKQQFHWEAVSQVLYDSIEKRTDQAKPTIFSVFKLTRSPMIRLGLRERIKRLQAYLIYPVRTLWRLIPDEGRPIFLSRAKRHFTMFVFFMLRTVFKKNIQV